LYSQTDRKSYLGVSLKPAAGNFTSALVHQDSGNRDGRWVFVGPAHSLQTDRSPCTGSLVRMNTVTRFEAGLSDY
jgi:hypothetical protein